MTSILRQIVAGPRARHPDAGLDLCYVTDNIIATSGPSSVWPKKAYRNPTDQLVAFLDRKHAEDWAIFEFRAEGTGYPDSEVYNRIHHFPWPDHHPPPFSIIPNLMAAMRNWVQRMDEEGTSEDKKKRVAVVHCKAGKGRSGTVACSYLISEEGWKRSDALQRFTERRMRVGFGLGVSIPSQLRWVTYVDRWTNSMGKRYVERPVEIVEIHCWGLRDGVKVCVEGYRENGRKIEIFHTFTRQEKTIIEEGNAGGNKTGDNSNKPAKQSSQSSKDGGKEMLISPTDGTPPQSSTASFNNISNAFASNIQTIILKPSEPLILPTSDMNIDFERRSQASSYAGFTMVTSIAHVWFNAYFEGGHEGHDSGVFAIDWEAMDGIKGSPRKGSKALDRLKVVWRYPKPDPTSPTTVTEGLTEGASIGKIITEPSPGEPVPEGEPADWRGEDTDPVDEAGTKKADGVDSGRPGGSLLTMGTMIKAGGGSLSKELGLRKSDPASADISRAQSLERGGVHESTNSAEAEPRKSAEINRHEAEAEDEEYKGLRAHGPEGEDHVPVADDGQPGANAEARPDADTTWKGPEELTEVEGRQDTKAGKNMELGMAKLSNMIAKMKGTDSLNSGSK